jgi:hypothetical protein
MPRDRVRIDGGVGSWSRGGRERDKTARERSFIRVTKDAGGSRRCGSACVRVRKPRLLRCAREAAERQRQLPPAKRPALIEDAMVAKEGGRWTLAMGVQSRGLGGRIKSGRFDGVRVAPPARGRPLKTWVESALARWERHRRERSDGRIRAAKGSS